MYFAYQETAAPDTRDGCLYYIQREQSLYYAPWRKNNYTLLIGKAYCGLDIELCSGEVLQLSGCHPMKLRIARELDIPEMVDGKIYFHCDDPLVSGSGQDYDKSWETYYDRSKGYICIGESTTVENCVCVRFCPNLAAAIRDGKLVSVWAKIKIV